MYGIGIYRGLEVRATARDRERLACSLIVVYTCIYVYILAALYGGPRRSRLAAALPSLPYLLFTALECSRASVYSLARYLL